MLHHSKAWSQLQGFWKVQQHLLTPSGEPLPPFPVNPEFPVNPVTIPYPSNPVFGFVNVTIQGSRLYQHVYHVYKPAPATFCDEKVSKNRVNVFGGGTCGEAGYLLTEDFFGTIASSGGEVMPVLPGENASYVSRAVDDRTLSFVRAYADTGLLKTETIVVVNTHHLSSIAEFSGKDIGIAALQRTEYERLPDAAAFTSATRIAYSYFQISEEDQLELPMTSDCLGTSGCPTDANWCAVDPTCNPSLAVVVPSSSSQSSSTGLAVGMTILVALFLIGVLYVFHVRALQQEAKRHRTRFARRIAENLERMVSPYALDADRLYDEMCKVDPGLYERSGALISKIAMKEFMQSGLVGYITEADFGALWAAIDDYNTGYVDFLEYCSLLAHCHPDYEIYSETCDREILAKMICKQLSKLARQAVKAKTKSLGGGTIQANERATSNGSNGSSADDGLMIIVGDDLEMEISAMAEPEGMADDSEAMSSLPSVKPVESSMDMPTDTPIDTLADTLADLPVDTPATSKSLGSASLFKSVKSLGSGVVYV